MIKNKLKRIQELAEGEDLLEKYYDYWVAGVSIDTRSLKEGNLFIPIIGENFDGHEFLDQAIKGGASGALWQKDRPIPDVDFPIIVVDDTLEALQVLAKNYKNLIKPLKVIGITGSNGKTATKDILFAILSRKFKTKRTIGNFNNHIGLPLTLLDLELDTEIAILEMGIDGFHQMEVLTNLANPNTAIVTNIGPSHLDLLESQANVARAKLKILDGMEDTGSFIYNLDNEVLKEVMEEYSIVQNKISFGKEARSDFKIEMLSSGKEGIIFNIYESGKAYEIRLPLMGPHNAYNAAASIAVARGLNMSYDEIREGLENLDMTGMRNEIVEKEDFTILNDAYKSNPDSLSAALDTLYNIDGYSSKAVVLGDMVDLGEGVEALHKKIGQEIKEDKISKIFTIGPLAKHIGDSAKDNFDSSRVFHSHTKKDLVKNIKENLDKGSLVLVKASRSVGLEDVIDKL